jgi:hypothetical protein
MLAPFAMADERSEPMPGVLREFENGEERILFVSAAEAFSSSGVLRAELFPGHDAIMVRRLLELPSVDGCIPAEEVFYSRVNVPFRESVDDAVAKSETIVQGVVDGQEFGFQFGIAGQLLRLRSLEILQGEISTGTDTLYAFVPLGRFVLGSQTICKTDYRYASAPTLGERVVAFLLPGRLRGQYAELTDEAGLVTVRKNDALSLPGRYESNDAPRTLSALRGRIERPLLEKKEE